MELSANNKATTLLWQDHQRSRELYQKFLDAPDPATRAELAEELLTELEIHAWLEERLVYPELARICADDAALAHDLGREHGELRRLVSEFRLAREDGQSLPAAAGAQLAGILAAFQRHVAEEETRALPVLEANSTRNQELGAALAASSRKLHSFPPFAVAAEVAVPASAAYNQWTQFEDFPRFLENAQEVRQLDDTHVRWRMTIGGREVGWTAEIYEQLPDRRIAWTSVEGAHNAGSVNFRPLAPGMTRVLVEIGYEPQGLLEDLGAMAGVLPRRVAADLQRFKAFMERRQAESGAWRGRIESDPAQPHI